jgi:very-short-patch-repair endonuclease
VAAEGGRGFAPRDKTLKPYSSELRKNTTKQENHLWYDFLRHNKPRFTRQRIIGKYIVDFYCHSAALVIELDGSQHYEPESMKHDEMRTACLNALGLRVLRFTNNEVDRFFESVCMMIKEEVDASSKCR